MFWTPTRIDRVSDWNMRSIVRNSIGPEGLVRQGLSVGSWLGKAAKGFGLGQVLGNIPDRMYPTNKSLFRDRKVISMPGKLEFKKKPVRVRHRSRYLRQRYVKRRNKFLL
jgi:hypothetical protein